MTKKYTHHLLFLSLITGLLVVLYFLGEIVLPFIFGLGLAYFVNPLVRKFQKVLKNRNLSITVFLFLLISGFGLASWGLGNQVKNDISRLNGAFTKFTSDHQEKIDGAANTVISYVQDIYEENAPSNDLNVEMAIDSLKNNTELLEESFDKITSFFQSDEAEEQIPEGYNWFFIFIYSIGYFLCCIYTFEYFENKFQKYFGKNQKSLQFFDGVFSDFKRVFLTYFKQRTKIVIFCSLIFTISFLIIGIPGAIVFGILAGLFCYIAHFHYLTIIPLFVCCWAQSIESGNSFFVYLGLVSLVFILVSFLEEMVFFPKIMKGVANMNPAIMMVSLAVWGYVFGTIGFFLALPLSTLILIYLDKVLLANQEK